MSIQSTDVITPRPTARRKDCQHSGYVMRNLQQYLAQRQYSLFIPLEILALVFAISVVIVLLLGIKTGLPAPPDVREGQQSGNLGPVMSFPFFLISAGALCANRQFSAALAFGSTRRNFWIGTLLGFAVTSMITGAFALLGLGLELLTNHWWIGVYAFDVAVLGRGNPASTMAIITLLSMASLLIGATYGMVFRSYGPKTLTLALIGTGLVLVALLAAFIWKIDTVVRLFQPWGVWTIAAGAGIVAIVAAVAGYWVCRHATI